MLLVALVVVFFVCQSVGMPAPPDSVLNSASETMIRAHLKFIGSDLLDGRAPGSQGEDIAAAYIESQLTMYGVQPAGDVDGSYFQAVPLQGCTPTAETPMSIVSNTDSWELTLQFMDDYVATTQLSPDADEWVTLKDSDIVFVGYGITAPELDWEDYKVNVTGKVVVILLGQPTVDEWADESYSYYSRWYEEAARQMAKAAFIVHTPETASYDWDVVQSSWGGTVTRGADTPENALTFTGWLRETLNRTFVFLFTTAEESGLLGSQYYISYPPSTLATATTLADINFDIGNAWGPTNDVAVLGGEKSTLGVFFELACIQEGMYESGDPQPSSGFFYRGDQFSFAKAGVPGVWAQTGTNFIGEPDDYYEVTVQEGYFDTCYHQPCDTYSDSISVTGMLQQVRVGIRAGYGIADSSVVPTCYSNCQ